MGALLAQFPPSFRSSPEARDFLDSLLRAFSDYPIAVELRHRSWSDEPAGTIALLNAHGAAFVQIDEPKFRFSIRQDQLPNIRTFHYMRLHGRNAAAWWRHASAEERYDYLYTPDELGGLADAAGAAGAEVETRGGVRVLQQPFRGEVGRQRRHDQAPARPGRPGHVPSRLPGTLPGLSGVVSVDRARPADTDSWSLER